jgi:hypothetical protein
MLLIFAYGAVEMKVADFWRFASRRNSSPNHTMSYWSKLPLLYPKPCQSPTILIYPAFPGSSRRRTFEPLVTTPLEG